MSILDIALLGHPVLREACVPVVEVAVPEVQTLIDDMIETTVALEGLRLAAPQVFQPIRLLVFRSGGTPLFSYAPTILPTAVSNPEILWTSVKTEVEWERCLSIPDVRVKVSRPRRIGVRYTDPHGRTVERDLDGIPARVFLHEADHLDGVIHFDRMASPRDIVMQSELDRVLPPQAPARS